MDLRIWRVLRFSGSIDGIEFLARTFLSEVAVCQRKYLRITSQCSCQGKSETLGILLKRDEMGYCYPVGDPEPGSGKSHLTKA